jgi:hypothetical protein
MTDMVKALFGTAVGRPNKGYVDFSPVDGSTVRRKWRHLKRGHKVLDEGLPLFHHGGSEDTRYSMRFC